MRLMRSPCLFLGCWDGDYVSQLPYVWYNVVVKSSFKHDREECESYVFYLANIVFVRTLWVTIFTLCITSWNGVVVSVMLYPSNFCVCMLMDQFVLCVVCLTVFLNVW